MSDHETTLAHSAATHCYASAVECMPPPTLAPLFARTPKGAILSSDRRYRYFLWRVFDPAKRAVNFIGLNPSTADEYDDDQTIRRCIGFAVSWGFGAVFMTNLYSFRSTCPSGLLSVSDPIGKANDYWLNAVATESGLIVACWGRNGGNRASLVLSRFFDRASHLGLNKDGSPKHPSRLRKDLHPVRFKERIDA